jgi:Amt family ammonium transporter
MRDSRWSRFRERDRTGRARPDAAQPHTGPSRRGAGAAGLQTATSPDPAKPLWPDPTGANAGYWATPSPGPVGDGDPSALTNAQLYDRIAHNLFSINVVWTLITGFLVMFMQAGFMLVETGLARAKNASHTSAMNFMIYPLGCLAFWVYGFAIGWGNWWNGPVPPGWYASLGPGLSVLNGGVGLGAAVDAAGNATGAYTYGILGPRASSSTASLATSAYGVLLLHDGVHGHDGHHPDGDHGRALVLEELLPVRPVGRAPLLLYANWVWGGGWLAQGGINWGSATARSTSRVRCCARHGRRDRPRGRDRHRPAHRQVRAWEAAGASGHNVSIVVLGTFILAFGWFGFNPGSTLSGTDLRITFVVVNTMLASITAAIAAMLTLWAKGLKPDPSMLCNGMLAGLVAITAPCAFVDPWAAGLIGAIAASWWSTRSSSSNGSASTTSSARSRCTARTGSGASSRSASSPTVPTGRDGTGWYVRRWSPNTDSTACVASSTATRRSSSCS